MESVRQNAVVCRTRACRGNRTTQQILNNDHRKFIISDRVNWAFSFDMRLTTPISNGTRGVMGRLDSQQLQGEGYCGQFIFKLQYVLSGAFKKPFIAD